MKILQAVTLALVGWYLMSPPSGMSESNKFSDWDIVNSYDSAAECRKAQIDNLKNAGASTIGNNLANRDNAEATMMAKAAKCIATDDPRLEEK